jgi:hypothetical protein
MKRPLAPVLLLLGGCSLGVDLDYEFVEELELCPRPPTGACDSAGQRLVFIISGGDLGREAPDGVAPGFDLDGTDVGVCGQDDYVSPDGERGIDNQFAPWIAFLEGLLPQPIPEARRAEILEGRELRMIEIEGVDDLADDPCVSLRMRDAEVPAGFDLADLDREAPMGVIDPGLAFDYTRPAAFDDEACIRDGRLFADLQDVLIPFGVAGPEVLVERHHASATLTADEDGRPRLVNGVEGGSVESATLDEILFDALMGMSLSTVVPPDLDLDESGACHSTSFVFTFEAVEARLGAPL